MKVKVRKITDKKALHIQYILPEREINIFKDVRKEYKEVIKAIRQAI